MMGLYNQSGVKCSDSGAEEVEILSDSIRELTRDKSWLKSDIYLSSIGACIRRLISVQIGDKYVL